MMGLLATGSPGGCSTSPAIPVGHELSVSAEPAVRTGPWGRLQLTRIDIEPPRAAIIDLLGQAPRWVFPLGSRAQVLDALREAGLSPREIEQCDRQGVWETTTTGMVLRPPLAVVLGMSPGPRETLYRTLARTSDNHDQRDPIPLPPGFLQSMDTLGLDDAAVTRFKALLYGSGPWHLFADLPALLMSLPNDRDRVRWATVTMRAESYVVDLRVDARSDVDALVRYWSLPGQDETFRPLLESLTRVVGGVSIGVGRFLPAFVHTHRNRFPRPTDPIEARADCFWTALNFASDSPRVPVDDPAFVLNALKLRFHPTTAAPQLGTLIVLLNERGAPVHAAVHIADDLVFTKNGTGAAHPWTFMKLASMVDLYTTLVGRLRVVFLTEIAPAPPSGNLANASGPTFRN